MSIQGTQYSSQDLFIKDSEVEQRNNIIKSILLYKVDLTLQKGTDYYGTVEIHLDLHNNNQNSDHPIQIDFGGLKVEFVKIRNLNEYGAEFRNITFSFERNRVMIDYQEFVQDLKESNNKISILISFQNQYNTTVQDRGIFSTITGENQYLHTQGEVASMHYIFPCIEQINFRAPFQLSLVHPSDWVVISNSCIIEQQSLNKVTSFSKFETTQPFPCYLYGIFAGNYVVYRDKYKEKIDLNIYCRKEKAKIIENQISELFCITKFGLNLMEEYTQIDYYMKKLDQIFCDNYNFYGMENPGCISLEGRFKFEIYFLFYSQIIKEKRYIFEEEREPLKIMRRSYIMFHEIAHMWFGDFVSLEWWNNLFLKEGFATFFGYKAVSKYYSQFDYGIHIELQKVLILIDENKDKSIFFQCLKLLLRVFKNCIKVITLSHEKLPYYEYSCYKAHNCISYNKGGMFFQFLEQKVYGEQKFQELIRQFLTENSFSKVDETSFLKHFNDIYSQKYLFKNHLSYFDDYQFKDLINLGLVEENYKSLDLSFIVVSKITKNIITAKYEDLSKYPSTDNIILLNTSENHLIFNRIKQEDLKFLDENNIIEKFNLQQRMTIWNTILFENIQFQKLEYFNDFFLQNFQYENNMVVLHYILRVYPLFSKQFTDKQEDKIINLYQEEKDLQKKRIILKNLIRYINSEKNTFNLLQIYEGQERKVKPKYLNKLKLKIKKIYEVSIQKISNLENKQ
ncbi:hypothetical protein ABPG74_017269 [Tetrahymena malaccensis]